MFRPWADVVLVGLQALGLLATLALLRRASAAPRERRKKRRAVRLTAQDRLAAAAPVVAPLRPTADPRVDGAQLLRCEPVRASGAALLLLPGGNYDSCAVPWLKRKVAGRGQLKLPLEVAMWLNQLGLVVYILRSSPEQVKTMVLRRQGAMEGVFSCAPSAYKRESD